jgi:hypothetical protein
MRTVTKKGWHSTHKSKFRGVLKEKKWESKALHGQYIKSTERQLIREGDTFLWLSWGGLKGEIKAQALKTKHNATKILPATDSKCRLSKQFDETVEHIISTYPILAKEEYILRHDTVTYVRK